MTRSTTEALAAVIEESRNPTLPAEGGRCLQYVRYQYLIGMVYGSAAEASRHADLHATAPPPGVPVWWQGGTHGFGHVAISAGNGLCYSTDIARIGRFNLTAIDNIRKSWGLTYVGWSYDLNEVDIPHDQQQGEGGGDPLDPPEGDWLNMATLNEVRALLHESAAQMRPVQVPDEPEVYAWDGTTLRHVWNPDYLNGLRAVGAIVSAAPDTGIAGQVENAIAQTRAWGTFEVCGCTSGTCRLK